MDTPHAAAPLGLDEIATLDFRASAEAEQIGQQLKDALGFGAHYQAPRLAIARSLAVAAAPPAAPSDGRRAINGRTLFGPGADLAAWVSLLVEHAGRAPQDRQELQAWVRAHWARGMALLGPMLEEAGRDSTRFWRLIAEATLPHGPDSTAEQPAAPGGAAPPPGLIALRLGSVSQDAGSGEPIRWPLNAPGGAANAAFMGASGTGKTRTVTAILRELRAATPLPLLAFDFKGDLTDKDNALDRAFGATVLNPVEQPIPLDVLALADRSPTTLALAAQRLRDSLSTLKGAGFGANQKELLAEAAERALRQHQPCRLEDIREALVRLYAERGRKEDGAVATLRDLTRLRLFAPEHAPAEFFARSWIIRLPAHLPDLVKVSVVTLITDALDRYANSLPDAPTDAAGNRALRYAVLIDEAHRILGERLPGLSGLLRVSRSKGGVVFLSSQSPDDFSGEDDEFLDQMGLVLAFRCNAEPGAARRILGPRCDLAALARGEAWLKIGGEATRRLRAW
ncbi:DndE family protein [Rubritepida flocculans]|uniref:DndE family protein n=1 Tax=Rubritepida flocculans TaxID=182403 RepID=UPI00040B546B|nr:DndE family protein [Rubritepida flocculans]